MSVTVKSQNDVLWFCLVLLVEVFGLSVALGGPWIEVSYFLLVVVSQTVAGAYIWAQLRKDELRLPIPELLAMGFAIGSSTAAISQLFLRDLLGVRLMISPYVPIIAVAIWLIFKRSPRLAVEITHTDSTTLLWLLFPAPLALSHYVWLLLPAYLAPLLLFLLLLRRAHIEVITRNIKKIVAVATLILALFTNYVISALTNVSPSRVLAEADLLFDVGHAVTFANFGINENIAMAGQNFQYYKFSHLWLGPILLNTTEVGITVATTIIPLLFLLMIGMALWTLTYYFSNSNRAANIASVLFFALATIPEPILLEIRIAYLFPYFILICGGVIILKHSTVNSVTTYTLITFTVFVVTYSRIFLLPALMVFTTTAFLRPPLAKKGLLNKVTLLTTSYVVGSSFAIFLLFFTKESVALREAVQIPRTSSLVSFANAFTLYGLIILFGASIFKANRLLQTFTLCSIAVMFSLHLLVPRQLPSGTTFLLPLLLNMVPILATTIHSKFQKWSPMIKLNIALAVTASVTGFAFSSFYFKYQYIVEPGSVLMNAYWWLFIRQLHSSNIEFTTLRLQVFELLPILFILLFLFSIMQKSRRSFDGAFTLVVVAVLFGNSIAITARHFLLDPSSTSPALFADEASQSRRWLDNSRTTALDTARSLIKSGSTIATNFGNYETDGPNDTYLVPTELRARSYLSPPYPDPTVDDEKSEKLNSLISNRKSISINFPTAPSDLMLRDLAEVGAEWFIVDLERTELRDWEPWATTRFINDKVAILELANSQS